MLKKEIECLHDEKTEKDIHDNIESFLRRNGIPYDHSRMDKRTTNKRGHPDFSIFMYQHVLFIEVKKPGEKLSEDQTARHAELGMYENKVEVCFSYVQARDVIIAFQKDVLERL